MSYYGSKMRLNLWSLIFLFVTQCGPPSYHVGPTEIERQQADDPLYLEYVGQSSERPQVVQVSENLIQFTCCGFRTLVFPPVITRAEVVTQTTTSFSFELTTGTAKGKFEKNGTQLPQSFFAYTDWEGYNLIIQYPGKLTQEILVGRLPE